ncbi:hypothetical protein L208DRAFT_1325588 [Tricholoma matsutake]|nr:hypothetical protein L208DRAFT_1325588 [Tricholoma matsutake 945]
MGVGKYTRGLPLAFPNNALQCIPWSGLIHGFEVAIPTSFLSVYGTREWFSDEHEDQMLDLLWQEMMESGISSSADIENTQWSVKLRQAYRHQEQYGTGADYGWLHATGKMLADGTRDEIGMIANINHNHWIAVSLNFKNRRIVLQPNWTLKHYHQILYGDSLRDTPNQELIHALKWWTHLHTGHIFMVEDLPISRQQDGYSCGLLAWNALMIYLLQSKNYTLMDPKNIDDERLKVLLRITEQHQDQVGAY